jgi:hypothetical protein
MKVSTYLSVLGILAIVFGIGFLVAAPMTLPMYGLPTDPSNTIQARYFGSALGGLGFLAWLIRSVNEPSIQRGALIACAISTALGVIVSLWGLIDKVLGPLAWSSVVIYGGLLLGSLYCLSATTKGATA